MSHYNGYVVIFGGGTVGTQSISLFKANNWWVGCVDSIQNSTSKESISHKSLMHTTITDKPGDTNSQNETSDNQPNLTIFADPNKDIREQEFGVLSEISSALDGKKLDAVICVASDFILGNAREELSAKMDLMWKQNVWPSILATSIAVTHMKEGGILCLSGEKSALEGTPTTIGYGLAKAAIHQLTKSLASEGSALPANSVCVALLPTTIDAVIKNQAIPQVDISAWTPTKHITDLLLKWCNGIERPVNGSLIQFRTKNFNTEISIVDT